MHPKEKDLLRRALKSYQGELERELAKPGPEYRMVPMSPVSGAPTALIRVNYRWGETLDDDFRELFEQELGAVKALRDVMSTD